MGKKSITKRLDDLWREKVKDIAGWKCEVCGKKEYLNSHHIYSRSNKSTRWYIPNGICLCAGHHTLCTDSFHKAPLDRSEWVKAYRGIDWFDALTLRAKKVMKINDAIAEAEIELKE